MSKPIGGDAYHVYTVYVNDAGDLYHVRDDGIITPPVAPATIVMGEAFTYHSFTNKFTKVKETGV